MSTITWQSCAQQLLDSELKHLTQLSGGDFAEAFRAILDDGSPVFVKTHKEPPPLFFSTEAHGLNWLRETGVVNVPRVLAVSDDPPLLVLEWVPPGSPTRSTESDFGRQLAALHAHPHPAFGRSDMRTTGSQAVPNQPCQDWAEFYATQRLLPLAKIAGDEHRIDANTIATIKSVAQRLDELGGGSTIRPSLLHGDLWAGNRLVGQNGESWLIDPAVHGGHREFDLAMMQLFGGYGDECFGAYQEVFPLAPGWKQRVALHQLAPLIVHAIKFGGHYRDATRAALEQYR